ncbi:LysR family transcriptional regulator [Nocardioides insulae]|uniref:LysR family transcriptional regulator n=1 Tax=Nocardioides insulae TaxID=394734 RepID=UPI0004094D7A|nr:LysR family transcriptional regulator [Nocardioides insulae]
MQRYLDLVPLRSFVAIADCGGFQRAATSLHLSQGAVSQHVRRLEAAIGRPLLERHGRGSRFTAAGEQLLPRARRLLALHDDTVRDLAEGAEEVVTIGTTEHAAAQLLPRLTSTLEQTAPEYRFRFRIDRGQRLRDALASGTVDLALQIDSPDQRGLPIGDLALTWYAAPGWRRGSPDSPVPVVAFDKPCPLRNRAVDTLTASGLTTAVGAEAPNLAGVHAAVAAGLGVALLATLGETPAGLVECSDLPEAQPVALSACPRQGLPQELAERTAASLRPLLAPAASRRHPTGRTGAADDEPDLIGHAAD